jgi:Tfp pilus assembly protein PilF
MSLLMKALEKAAKDRGEARPPAPASAAVAAPATPEPAAKAPKLELSLEPLPAATPPPPPEPAAPPPRATAQSRNERNQARAATVMQAGARSAPETTVRSARLRLSPVMMLGIAGGIVALGFAVYVYLQVTNPGLFIRKPPPAPQPLAQPAPVQSPIATAAVVTPATPAEAATSTTREVSETRRPGQPTAAAPQPPSARTPEAPSSRIQISAGDTEPQIDNRLTQAYAALQSGKNDSARQLYGDVLRSDPRNINALLGLAALALQQDQADEASRLYMRVLELDPRNPYAQTGLIGMMGRADPAAAEARLKQLIARGPTAALHFTLGNVYADQSRWAEAQQAYFQAHHLEPSNPDYAYNLAVGLEHVGQPKLASGFYRQAVDLAQSRGRAGFNLEQAQDRIRQLSTQQ